MHLIHTTQEEDIIKILTDGYLRCSKYTGNIRMFGQAQGSEYIYLRLNKKNDFGTFVLDKNLLLKNNFYLRLGWTDINNKILNGKNYNEESLDELINKFNIEVNKYYNKIKQRAFPPPIMMSNEILVSKKISLKKYLIQVNLGYEDKKIINFIKNNYPNTKISYPNNK